MTIRISELGIFQPQITFKEPVKIEQIGRPNRAFEDDLADDLLTADDEGEAFA